MVHRIAHISDVHLVETRKKTGFFTRLAQATVSYDRPIEVEPRRQKLRAALAHVKDRADHVVVSGDLTEVGSEAEYESFAEILHESGLSPDDVTLVPGNHDVYVDAAGWRKACDGPLAAFRAGAAGEHGRVVERGNVVFFPLDSTRDQFFLRSGGAVAIEAVTRIMDTLRGSSMRDKTVVVAMHHPPGLRSKNPIWQWFDGLVGCGKLLDLLGLHPRVHVLHGHRHTLLDRIAIAGRNRVFGATATVDDEPGAPRVRFYGIDDGVLVPA
jgi:3',5'-cyclic AMP phosphodiesterase CpdA